MTAVFTKLENTPAETVRGIVVFLVASAIIPLLDAFGKLLVTTHGLPPGEVAMIRLVLQAVMILPALLLMEGRAALAIAHPLLNLLRGALLGIAGVAFFGALRFMPLADATAIFFVEPMFITLLSGLVLKETVGWRRIAAIVVGFVGALIVIRPNFVTFGIASVLPMLAAACIALYLILGRRLSRTATPLAMLFYAGVGGTATLLVLSALAAPFDIADLALVVPQGLDVWLLLIGAGVIGTIGHLMFLEAYRLAPAAVLAPFGYMEIVTAVFLGFVLFGDFPDGPKWIGIAIIVASGVFIYLRERRLSRRPVSQTPVH